MNSEPLAARGNAVPLSRLSTWTARRDRRWPLFHFLLLLFTSLGVLSPVGSLSEIQGAENWPEFRGPRADGSSLSKRLPTRFAEGAKTIRWKIPIQGKAWSSPVIWENRIWLTNATEDGKDLSVLCIDAEQGKILHDVPLFHIEKPQYSHPVNSHATATPAIEAGRLYVHFGSAGTACLETATAKVLWKRQDLPCNHFRGHASSPILAGSRLLIHFDGYDFQYIVALDKASGKTVWKKDRTFDYGTDNGDAKKAYATPALARVGGRTIVISPTSHATLAYDLESGDEIWRVMNGGFNVAARPLVSGNRTFINTGEGGFRLYALRLDGQGDVTKTHVDWRTSQSVPARSSQLLLDGTLYMISDDGVASAVSATNGKTLWKHRISGRFSASPLLADGKIWFCGEDGKVHVVAASPAGYQLLAENRLTGSFMASPAVYRDSLILRTKTHLYRVDEAMESQR